MHFGFLQEVGRPGGQHLAKPNVNEVVDGLGALMDLALSWPSPSCCVSAHIMSIRLPLMELNIMVERAFDLQQVRFDLVQAQGRLESLQLLL